MAYPLLESPLGSKYFFDGNIIDSDSDLSKDLLKPTDEVTYYETIRIKEGVLLYAEDHLKRLEKSVKGIEDFPIDTKVILDSAYVFLRNHCPDTKEGNLRIVLTKNHLLIHICEANIPSEEHFRKGIVTASLKWDRVDPNIKVFRGDYKKAVADVFASKKPYEVVLTDSQDKLYEGSKSNLFVVVGNKIYTAPDDKILLGITRNRVISSLTRAGGELLIGTFTIDELVNTDGASVFVSSTPFDILPIAKIDDHEFDSANDPMIRKISECYRNSMNEYIKERR